MTAVPANPSPPERDHVTLTAIADVVRESRRQLQGSPPHALPELTERLARQHLTRIAVADPADPGRAQGRGADIGKHRQPYQDSEDVDRNPRLRTIEARPIGSTLRA